MKEEDSPGMNKKRKKTAKKPLTDQQLQAAQYMFEGHRIGQIAAEIGVHRTTIWRWYNRRNFQQELHRINQQYLRDTRRRIKKQIRESPEHKQELAARRRLPKMERELEKAGNSGNMNAYRKAVAAYDRCFNMAYGACLNAFCDMFNSQKSSQPKKASNPKRYIIEIID